MAEFDFIPVSPLIGSKMGNYLTTIKQSRVEKKYLHKVILTGIAIAIATPFHWYESLRDPKKRPLKQPPVFIVGHWRSGTTFLHNLLCQAKAAGYMTTYQSIFPNNLYSKWVFKTFVNLNIPDKRPTDNVKLGASLPQEDEFAFENVLYPSLYNFFYFPDNVQKSYNQAILFKGKTEKDIIKWQEAYHKLLLKGEINSAGDYMVMKNPANTGRLDQLLKLYPNARFIHIHRNPVIVYLSTKSFFEALFPSVNLHDISKEGIKEVVFDLYPKLMKRYLAQRSMIPGENLIDIKFEEFEKDPLDHTMKIHRQFNLGNSEESKKAYKAYLAKLKGYKKSTYKITAPELDRVKTEWAFAFEEFGYGVPDNIEVI